MQKETSEQITQRAIAVLLSRRASEGDKQQAVEALLHIARKAAGTREAVLLAFDDVIRELAEE